MNFMEKARVKALMNSDDRVPMKVFITPEAKRRIKAAAKALHGYTMAEIVTELIMDNLPPADELAKPAKQ